MDENKKPVYRKKLEQRREEIFRVRRELIESRRELSQPEIEPEETAAKEKIMLGLESLDEREKQEIEDIDWALRKLETGSYGLCESCGREISDKRLDALPWTRSCKSCADSGEEGPSGPADEIQSGSAALDYAALSDEELVEAVLDKIRYDGRVELDELRISSQKGVIYLEGALPSEENKQILLDILENILGLEKIVDHVVTERQLWQREDRTPPQPQSKRDEEVLFQGEGVDSEEEGLSESPPDHLVPEREE